MEFQLSILIVKLIMFFASVYFLHQLSEFSMLIYGRMFTKTLKNEKWFEIVYYTWTITDLTMDCCYLGILQFQIYDWINMILVIKIMLSKVMAKEEKGIVEQIDPERYVRA